MIKELKDYRWIYDDNGLKIEDKTTNQYIVISKRWAVFSLVRFMLRIWQRGK